MDSQPPSLRLGPVLPGSPASPVVTLVICHCVLSFFRRVMNLIGLKRRWFGHACYPSLRAYRLSTLVTIDSTPHTML